MTTEKTQVKVKRTELPTPDLADPEKRTVHVEYTIGDLPPRFIYINKKDWTPAKEAELIKADLNKRITGTTQTISI